MSDSIKVNRSTAAGRPSGRRHRQSTLSRVASQNVLWLVIVVIFLVFALTAPNFLSITNLFNIVLHISIIGIIAVGMTFVIIAGGIDLSVGSMVALSGILAAFIARDSRYGTILPIIGAVGVGALAGCVMNGLLISEQKLNPFIVTLASMSIYRGVGFVLTGAKPIYNLNDAFLSFSTYKIGSVLPIPVAIFLFIVLIAYLFQRSFVLSRHVYIVGGSQEVAYFAGIPVKRVLIFVYTLSGALTGLAGVLLTSRVGSGDPNLGLGYELSAIAAVIIGGTSLKGGRGGIEKTITGILIIALIDNGLSLLNVFSYWQEIIQGVIILIAVQLDIWRYGIR